MPENSKKIFIATRTSEIFIIRRGRGKGIRVFCPNCEKEVEMLTLDEAVGISEKNTRQMLQQIDAGRLHALETESGHF